MAGTRGGGAEVGRQWEHEAAAFGGGRGGGSGQIRQGAL